MVIIQDVISRLRDLGYDAIENDSSIAYAINRAKERILNDINCTEIPEGLRCTFIDMACGYYLQDMKATGTLETGNSPVSSITEGDVSVSFDTNLTPDAKLSALVQSLINPNPSLFSRYRRVKW